MDAPELAVVVTTYQMPGHLRRALESIACQRTERRLEVIVADDGSTDETPRVVAEFATRAPFPVRFVTHPHTEFHPARSRNDGVRNSTAPHLLFFDGDCVLPPNHIETHLAHHRPGVATCGYCLRLDPETSERITLDSIRAGSFVELAPPAEMRKLLGIYRRTVFYNLVGHPTKPSFKSTDFSIARADYERVNGFDEMFQGWGCEDDDFGLRLKRTGVRLESILHRTRAYHCWHPPAPTKPALWKQGPNYGYLRRPIRPTRCLRGLTTRRPSDVTVRLAGEPRDRQALDRLLKRHGWRVEFDPAAQADLELLPWPGDGWFRGRGDCRVLALLDDNARPPIRSWPAQVVLSPSGQLGQPNQMRLKLDNSAGLWQLLTGEQYAWQQVRVMPLTRLENTVFRPLPPRRAAG